MKISIDVNVDTPELDKIIDTLSAQIAANIDEQVEKLFEELGLVEESGEGEECGVDGQPCRQCRVMWNDFDYSPEGIENFLDAIGEPTDDELREIEFCQMREDIDFLSELTRLGKCFIERENPVTDNMRVVAKAIHDIEMYQLVGRRGIVDLNDDEVRSLYALASILTELGHQAADSGYDQYDLAKMLQTVSTELY